MAITTAERTQIIELTVLMFNAAPGATYLAQIVALYEANPGTSDQKLQALANQLATTSVYNSMHPNFETAEEFAADFLTPLGLQNDAVAKDFIIAKVNAGVSKGQIAYEAYVALNAVPSTGAAQYVAANAILNNKTTVAEYYSVTADGAATDLASLKGVIASVTSADASVTNAIAVIAGTAGGSTLNLTLNQDTLTGTGGNDTFVAGAGQDFTGALANTLQNVDALDGGAGTDTLAVTLATAGAVTASIKNIELVNARFANATAVLDLAATSGVTTVTVADSTTAGAVSNIGSLASLGVKNQKQGVNIDGTAGSATTMALALDAVGTGAAPIVLDLGVTNASKVTTANITANNANVNINSTKADVMTTANIAATGSNQILFTDSGLTLTKVTVSGAGSLDLSGANLAAVTTLDASANSGGVEAAITNAAKAVTITGGSGADVIGAIAVKTTGSSANLGAGNDTLYVGANLAAFDKGANGGDGTDIINITDGATLTLAASKFITNFETLDVSGGKGNYDVSLNSFTTVQIDQAIAGPLAAAVDFKNAPDAFTLTIASEAKSNGDFAVGQTIAVTGKDYTGTTAKADAETFTLVANINDANKDNTADGNIDANTVTVAGVENVVVQANVVSTDGGTTGAKNSAYSLTANLVAAQAETLTISGSAMVDLDGVTTIGVVSKIDATGNTGGTKISMATHATSVAFTGGDGVDTYVGSTVGDIVYTGKGADAVTFTGGVRDTFVVKAATDSQITDTSKDAKITIGADTGFDAIAGFTAAGGATDDRLDLTNFGFSGAQRGVADVNVQVGAATDLTSIADLFSTPAGDRGVAVTQAGGADTYVLIDANKDGNFTAADDIVIKLTGVAAVSESTINF